MSSRPWIVNPCSTALDLSKWPSAKYIGTDGDVRLSNSNCHVVFDEPSVDLIGASTPRRAASTSLCSIGLVVPLVHTLTQ